MSGTVITTILVAVLSGGGISALLALLLFPSQRAKLGAEREAVTVAASVQLAGGYGELVAALRTEIGRLETSLSTSRAENARLDESLDRCRREIAELRGELGEFRRTLNGPKEQP